MSLTRALHLSALALGVACLVATTHVIAQQPPETPPEAELPETESGGDQTDPATRTGIGWWMDFYDRRRPHSALNDRTPAEAYTDDGANGSLGLCPGSRQPKVA